MSLETGLGDVRRMYRPPGPVTVLGALDVGRLLGLPGHCRHRVASVLRSLYISQLEIHYWYIMVSKKKRASPSGTSDAGEVKKVRTADDAGTSEEGKAGGGAPKKQTKAKEVQALPKTEDDFEEHPVPHTVANDDIPDWPEADLLELMKRMEKEIPRKDNLRYDSRADKLNWESISFGVYTAEQCKEMWGKIQKRLRRFRLLRELLEDAKSWVSKPWTNFYRSQKQNRHPDMPRRPLSTYMLFYLEKKDKVARENPGLEMTGVSKMIAEMYKTLPEKKKKKYMDMAALQRQEYEQKMEEFYREHPELIPKPVPSKEQRGSMEIGPRKPMTPFKLFYAEKERRHKNEPDFDRADLLEKCKDQWKNMSDKKKVVWINWALEEEAKYEEQLKAYMSENPSFVPSNIKAILTKEEKHLRERVAGKPEKPPNSGYSLFSRIMLVSPEIKQIAPKERMGQISKLWKSLNETEKKKYQEQVNHMLDQYKLEYATYLESLPEDKRQEELQNNQPRRKAAAKPAAEKPPEKNKVPKKKAKAASEDKQLYKGEPEPPPVNAYQLFLKSFLTESSHLDPDQREKEAPRYWQMLPDVEKGKYRKRLNEMKQKYIKDYEKFLKSLSQEELKEYSLQKKSLKEEIETSESEPDDDDDEDDDDSSDDSKDGNSDNQQDSGSDDDSSSGSGSDSNESSDSSESEGENANDSGDSSSSDSESD